MRNEVWKLVLDTNTGRRNLYNLNRDPGEKNDQSEKEAAVADGLETSIREWIKGNRERQARIVERHAGERSMSRVPGKGQVQFLHEPGYLE